MHGLAFRLIAASLLVVAASGAACAQAAPDPTVPARVSERIIGQFARADLDAVAAETTKYLGANASERLKNSFASIKDLGRSQYAEMIYSRDFGQAEKDIIYKIDFDKAFAFVRFLWHVDNGDWHLVHLSYKTESEFPLPQGWEHIYPK